MSFTTYKWGVSKPYRALWPVLGFSSLRTDYARVIQLNNFLIKVVTYTFRRGRYLRKYINFSHILIKTYLIHFYERPIFSLELFFWIRKLRRILLIRFKKVKPKVKKKRDSLEESATKNVNHQESVKLGR